MKLPENELITLDEEYRITGIRKLIGISTIFLSVAVFLVLCTLFTGVLGTASLVLLLLDILAIYVPFLSTIISQYLSSKRAWKKRLKLETEGAFIEGTISAVRHVCADESTESYDYLIVNYVDNKITHLDISFLLDTLRFKATFSQRSEMYAYQGRPIRNTAQAAGYRILK